MTKHNRIALSYTNKNHKTYKKPYSRMSKRTSKYIKLKNPYIRRKKTIKSKSMSPERFSPEMPERISPERISPEMPERISPERISPERISPERFSPEMPERISPEMDSLFYEDMSDTEIMTNTEMLNQVKFDHTIPPQTLAIGIFTHGSIIGELCDENGCTAKKNKNYPEGVSVRVKHDGPYGGVCGYTFNKTDALAKTKNALTHLDGCIDRATFSERIAEFESYKPIILLDNACELVEGTTDFDEKVFIADSDYPQMYIMIQLPGEKKERCVSLIDGDFKSLYDFFKTTRLDGDDDETLLLQLQLHTLISRFLSDRSTSMCTTTLFFLISIAHKFLNVTSVNILDKSCNPVSAPEGYIGDTFRGFILSKDVKRRPGTGFGGKLR